MKSQKTKTFKSLNVETPASRHSCRDPAADARSTIGSPPQIPPVQPLPDCFQYTPQYVRTLPDPEPNDHTIRPARTHRPYGPVSGLPPAPAEIVSTAIPRRLSEKPGTASGTRCLDGVKKFNRSYQRPLHTRSVPRRVRKACRGHRGLAADQPQRHGSSGVPCNEHSIRIP